jgi:hypothetical protein
VLSGGSFETQTASAPQDEARSAQDVDGRKKSGHDERFEMALFLNPDHD